MICPLPSESLATFERVYLETRSIESAADAVAKAAVALASKYIGGTPASKLERRGALANLPTDLVVELVIEAVCEARGVERVDLLKARRGAMRERILVARWIAVWLLADAAGRRLREVAEALAFANASGAQKARAEFRPVLAKDKRLASEVSAIVATIRERASFAQRRAA